MQAVAGNLKRNLLENGDCTLLLLGTDKYEIENIDLDGQVLLLSNHTDKKSMSFLRGFNYNNLISVVETIPTLHNFFQMTSKKSLCLVLFPLSNGSIIDYGWPWAPPLKRAILLTQNFHIKEGIEKYGVNFKSMLVHLQRDSQVCI